MLYENYPNVWMERVKQFIKKNVEGNDVFIAHKAKLFEDATK
jgi:predicted RNase H-related nuclease YkuK (DUF458 family)